MKILILDDIPEYVRSLGRALGIDHEVVAAHSLSEAKDKMKDVINLVLVDVRLSEEEVDNRAGLEFLKWMKENYPGVPVVMMSAYKDFDAVKISWDLGAEKYLKKPVSLRDLKELISSFEPDK